VNKAQSLVTAVETNNNEMVNLLLNHRAVGWKGYVVGPTINLLIIAAKNKNSSMVRNLLRSFDSYINNPVKYKSIPTNIQKNYIWTDVDRAAHEMMNTDQNEIVNQLRVWLDNHMNLAI